MLKVMLNDILINLKKNWIQILLDLILFIFLSSYILVLICSANTTLPITPEILYEFALTEEFLAQVMTIISAMTLYFLFSITKKMPLRLSKGMFVCAAGEIEKFQYISLQLITKIIFSFIFIFATLYFLTGRLFASSNVGLNIIQFSLWFFIILDINLKVGIGEQVLKKKDLQDYIIYSKEEEMVNYYWFCLLLFELIIFCTLSFLNIPLTLLVVLGWTLAFILNVYISYKCVSPILKKSLSYEDVYRQIPQTKEGY